MVSGEELEGSLGKVCRRSVGLHSHHPLVVWTRSELVEGGKKLANQKRRITAGRERAVTETAVCPVPLANNLLITPLTRYNPVGNWHPSLPVNPRNPILAPPGLCAQAFKVGLEAEVS